MSEDTTIIPEVVETEPETKLSPRSKGQGWPKGKKRSLQNLCRKNPHTAAVKVLELKAKGLPTSEIKQITGLKKQSIHQILQKFEPVFKALPKVQDYRRVKGDIVDSALLECFELMTDPEKKQLATLRDAAYAVRVLNDVSRLEAGLATAHVQSVNVNLNFTKARPIYEDSDS